MDLIAGMCLSFPSPLGFWHFLTCLECRTSHLLFLFWIEGADTHIVVNSVCLWREGEIKVAYSTLLLISLQCFQIVCVGLVCFSIFSFKEKQWLVFSLYHYYYCYVILKFPSDDTSVSSHKSYKTLLIMVLFSFNSKYSKFSLLISSLSVNYYKKTCLNSMKISIRWQNCTFPSLVIHGLKDQHFVLSKMNGCIDLCHLHWTPCTDMALSTQFWWQHFKFSETKAGVTMVEGSVIITWSVFWVV